MVDYYLRDARVLLGAKRYDGAAYLCGYVLEFALKARICKHLALDRYPPDKLASVFKTHSYDELKLLAGLGDWPKMKDVRLYSNWSIVSGWKPDWRYASPGSRTEQEVSAILKALTDRSAGILTWLKRNW